MPIPNNLIVNADDLGLTPSINRAIIDCFEHGYINSTSLVTNTIYFEETVNLIHENAFIGHIGVHINLAEGKPVSNFNHPYWLNEQDNWDLSKINRKINFFNQDTKAAFQKEIYAQIDKALSANIKIEHLDSHYHLHTLPCFYKLFLQAAKTYKLKLRQAQTYNEGNYLKYFYRIYINHLLKKGSHHYADHFETVDYFLKYKETKSKNETIEIMLHPDIDSSGKLTDHYDKSEMDKWIHFLIP